MTTSSLYFHDLLYLILLSKGKKKTLELIYFSKICTKGTNKSSINYYIIVSKLIVYNLWKRLVHLETSKIDDHNNERDF